MEVNYRLKELLIEVVENQLRDNNPKITKEIFYRLLSKGYDETTAKEMIASIIVDDIYYILKDKKPFDEKEFVKKLSKLK